MTNIKLLWSKFNIHTYVFLTLEVLQLAGPSVVRAHARAAQLAEEVLSLKNDTYECWTLIKPTLYWLYMHKYTIFLKWCLFLNLKPTLLYILTFFGRKLVHQSKLRSSFNVERKFYVLLSLGLRLNLKSSRRVVRLLWKNEFLFPRLSP